MVTETLRWRGGWARIAPWPGPERDTAHLTVGTETPPSYDVVYRCLARLRQAGYGGVVTNALTASDCLPFVDAGFHVRERLHLLEHDLLEHDLARLPVSTRVTRRVRRGDRPGVLALDQRAFDAPWRLVGASGFDDAVRATPAARVRVAERSGRSGAVAYAITGRARSQGYVQRVAVDPAARREGWGRTLVADG
ncbi:MAG: hypothetical protein ACRDZV_13350, partial [Acidimicrobiia bacterium]